MKILIFEGIATSGKSTIIAGLRESVGVKTVVADESETHIPIMQETDVTQVDFFKRLIGQLVTSDADLLVFDRLYLTQAFRGNFAVSDYAEIEELLRPYTPLTVYLEVDEAAIASRITRAAQHRESTWGEYLKTKGRSVDERAEYYIRQQRNQLNLLQQSTIPWKIFNTTHHNYDAITQEIKKLVS